MTLQRLTNGSMPNSLAAMSVQEFESRNRLVGPSDHIEIATPTVQLTNDAPASWDWRAHGVTTPVKSQLQCGNERAFGPTPNPVYGIQAAAGPSPQFLASSRLSSLRIPVSCLQANHGSICLASMLSFTLVDQSAFCRLGHVCLTDRSVVGGSFCTTHSLTTRTSIMRYRSTPPALPDLVSHPLTVLLTLQMIQGARVATCMEHSIS